jgi:hypothetical protein
MKCRNQNPEPGKTISGFVDNKKKNPDRPTLDTYIIFFGLLRKNHLADIEKKLYFQE